MKLRLITTIAAVVLGAVVATAPAGAAGTIGQYVTGSGYCWTGEMLATPPSMLPGIDTGLVGGGQTVGFKALLQKWNSTSRTWVTVVQSPLVKRYASWTILGVETWVTSTGQEVSGTWRFPLTNQSGYFRFAYAMYWYSASGSSVIGSTVAVAWGHRDDRPSSVSTTGASYVDYCKYPA